MMNPSHWRKKFERPSICMSRTKEGHTFESLGRIRSRIIRIRERRGLNLLLFETTLRSINQESPVSIRLLSQMGEREDNLSNAGVVGEITFNGFSLSKIKTQGLHITLKRRIQ